MPWQQGFLTRPKSRRPKKRPLTVSQPEERLSVRILEPGKDTIVAAAAVLTEAFEEDPVARALFPGDRYEKGLEAFYRVLVEIYSVAGLVYVLENVPGEVKSVALWNVPETKKKIGLDQEERGPGFVQALYFLARIVWILGVRTMVRLVWYSQFMMAASAKHEPSKPYQLELIGTTKDFRSRGAGAAIMAPKLARADAEGMPCVLVSANPKNMTFYKRHGYNVVAEEYPFKDWSDIPGDGPVVSFLCRSPVVDTGRTDRPATSS